MLLTELIEVPSPIPIYGDNQGAISLIKNPIVSNRSKHIDIKHHFLREKFTSNFITVTHVNTDENVADVFTKPVTRNKLSIFAEMLFG